MSQENASKVLPPFDPEAPLKRKLPHILREKTSERVYPKTLIVTALTAVTVALISSRLTDVVSSLVLVSLASLSTAFIGEFYRLTLEGAHRAMTLAVARRVDARLEELGASTPSDLTLEEEVAQEIDTPEEVEVEENPRQPLYWLFFHRLFVSRWAVAIVFALAALGTVAASYFVGQLAPPAKNYTVVQEVRPTRDISEETADELQASARAAAVRQADEASIEARSYTNSTRTELIGRIESLENDLALAQANAVADEAAIENLSSQILPLQRQLAQLQRQMEKMKADQSNQQSTDTTGGSTTTDPQPQP